MEPVNAADEDCDWGGAVSRALHNADGEEDQAPLDIMAGGGLASVPTGKIPLEQARNLIMMRQVASQIRRDEISFEAYLKEVNQIVKLADNGIKLFSVEALKTETAKLPPEQLELVQAFEKQVYVMKEGADLMAAYATTKNIDDLDRGLALIEQALATSSKIQDKALDISDQIEAEKAEAAAAKNA